MILLLVPDLNVMYLRVEHAHTAVLTGIHSMDLGSRLILLKYLEEDLRITTPEVNSELVWFAFIGIPVRFSAGV